MSLSRATARAALVYIRSSEIMLILGIESSCDETGAAIVKDGRYLLSNVVASQIEIHIRYGGVVPEVGSRQQLSSIIPVIKKALDNVACSWGGRIVVG